MRRQEESDAVKALRRKITRRRLLQLLGQGAGAALVARCAPAPTPEAPTPTTPAAPPKATATPVPPTLTPPPAAEPQVLIFGSHQDVANADPRDRAGDWACENMFRHLYDSLWVQEGWPPRLTPSVCKDYEGSDDGMEWIFHLDERARFHDGAPLTAADVEWTLKTTLRMQRPRASSLLPVMNEDSVEAVDDHTIRIVLTTPFADLPWLMGFGGGTFILNHEEVLRHEVNGDMGQEWLIEHAAGSGPFVIKRWEPGTLYEIEAFPDWWRGWRPEGRLAGVIWRMIRDAAERRMALIAGEVDVIEMVMIDDIPLIDANPGTHAELYDSLSAFYIKMNNQVEPFSDVNFRKFMAYAFDYEGFVATQGGPEICRLLTGPLPDGVEGHDPNLQPVYRQDLEEARRYLDMTPWADGGLEIDFVYVTGLRFEEDMGMMLAEPLAQFGIKLNMVPKVWPDLTALCAHPEDGVDTICIKDSLGPLATQWFRYSYYSPRWDTEIGGSYQSACFYKDPEFDAYLEQTEKTADKEERMERVREMQRMIMEDSPGIMAHIFPNVLGFSDRVKGFEYTGYQDLNFWPLWMEEA